MTEPSGLAGSGADSDSQSSCKDQEVVPDDTQKCDCLRKASQEIRALQMEDLDLLPYFQYIEVKAVPTDEREARRLVLECEKMNVIEGVLHHEDAADPAKWCIIVPKQLRETILAKAHSAVFSGHLSEWKVYDRLPCYYWWRGMRADVRHFCWGCLACASHKGPGRGVRPPLQPIPIKKPFRCVAVDVLQLPLTSRGNKYVVVFMDYFTKWVEAYAVPDQQTQTIARLLVENIVCRHGVPQELLSDRGSNFLSELMLELCSLLGIKKLNTSGYHPQSDALVEKFNCTLVNMISKHTDAGAVEWDQQLQLLLFAYQSMVQESTRESPFFLLYGRDPRLPTGTELDTVKAEYLVDMDDYRTELVVSMAKAKKIALENIC